MNQSLAPLYRRRVFQSHRKVDTHLQVAKALCAHDLHWKGNDVDTSLFKAKIHRLELLALKYGAEVVIRPEPFSDFLLVHMPLKGVAEIEADGEKISITPGQTALLAPKQSLRLWWQAGSEQLILKVSLGLFNEARTGDPASATPSLYMLPPQVTPHWEFLVQSLLGILAIPGNLGTKAAWIDDFERGIVQFLRDQIGQPSEAAAPTPQIETPVEGLAGAGNGRRLEVLEHYLQKKMRAPISPIDMAQAIGVSVRWLNILCQQYHGVAPMIMLRNMRLDAVHQQLMASPGVTITDTAFEFGFSHLGRFSSYYHHRFGELPRQTIAGRSM
jgi:AraC-like DNA-binding protein